MIQIFREREKAEKNAKLRKFPSLTGVTSFSGEIESFATMAIPTGGDFSYVDSFPFLHFLVFCSFAALGENPRPVLPLRPLPDPLS